MKIMNIEAAAFERLLEKVQSLCLIIEDASEKHRTKMLGDWIDNQEACLMLGLSSRKMQALRDGGKIAYTRIERRVFYRKDDIIRYLEKHLKQNSSTT